ncbi:hypothetical protein SR1949_04380 [Sphaerospermopsis reniformis]|uniref:Uncharacterized protein n=1 Tax=Sphaerospermopsis reniformis TaxID=531300 RepID=A0A479ZS65_9CYAN|nr:hypothetical protein SR1949_04380 [Sphaerospermopsis reniformis]
MRFLSESGYPGFEDLQDFYLDVLMMIERFFLSESGYPGFEDLQDFYLDVLMMIERFFCQNQDIQDLRIFRIFIGIF